MALIRVLSIAKRVARHQSLLMRCGSQQLLGNRTETASAMVKILNQPPRPLVRFLHDSPRVTKAWGSSTNYSEGLAELDNLMEEVSDKMLELKIAEAQLAKFCARTVEERAKHGSGVVNLDNIRKEVSREMMETKLAEARAELPKLRSRIVEERAKHERIMLAAKTRAEKDKVVPIIASSVGLVLACLPFVK
ncbi:uncharacterized protein LOC119999690 [Tripterygium wilfordii]|uniref:uncharacterized protein LOC119999690 n=1 Tax=Tripterygium wilfordii TaxID=458696 RepID=UPI0018F81E95|nr:uncharacterized protein LOC119999690 [Tripterygium wilfordii]